ncbi:MAG: beta-lactamase family protein [Nitrospirota bacterium]|nr:beta-lactamase family protein [Nitrospirota bacterium]
MRRRIFAVILLGLVLAATLLSVSSESLADAVPITGPDVPGMQQVEAALTSFMTKWHVPGGQVAIVKDGRLVYSRGFGYADQEAKLPAKPDTLFRIASVSKPITGVAIMKLVEEGQLHLDNRVFKAILTKENGFKPLPNAVVDPRLNEITVRMLLEHSGGWSRGPYSIYDQQVMYLREAADAFGEPRPAGPQTIIRYIMGKPLDFDPGTKFDYSNLGYNVLGRVIEAVSKMRYEDYVKAKVLAPAGITRMKLGKTRFKDRQPDEARYYFYPEEQLLWSVYNEEAAQVTAAYGGDVSVEAMDAHGGWLATASDLAKFVTAVDTKTQVKAPRQHILKQETVDLMTARPDRPDVKDAPAFSAKGWVVWPATGKWEHTGAIIGTSAIVQRLGDQGVTVAMIFNFLPTRDFLGYFKEMMDSLIPQLVQGAAQWPAHDLFDNLAR